MNYLTVEEVIILHDELLRKYGGLSGIRDYNALCSALDAPKAALFGMEMYPSAHEKSAVYLYHLICNHPFNDANKRSGCAVAMVFLQLNDIENSLSEEDFEDLSIQIASGKIKKEQVIEKMKSLTTI